MAFTLERTTGFNGRALGKLAVFAIAVTRSIDGNDVLEATVGFPAGSTLQNRSTLRLTDDDTGDVSEWRINHFETDAAEGMPRARLTGASPLSDFATMGVISQTQNGQRITSFGGVKTIAQWLTDSILTSLPADIAPWLDTTLGTISSTALYTLSFTSWTPLELMRSLETASNGELVLERQSGTGKYRIGLPAQRGSTTPDVVISQGKNLLQYASESDDADVVSVIEPFGSVANGDYGPWSIGENAWQVTAIDASLWVTLRDSTGAQTPVAFDDQYNNHGLVWEYAGTLQRASIVDSRAVDGAVKLSAALGLGAGMVVSITKSTLGEPLGEVSNPALTATDTGRRIEPITVEGGRGERNYMPNAQLQNGATGWSVGDAGAVIPRIKLNVTRTLQANGARSAGSSAALPIRGLTANEWVYEGDQLVVAGANMAITADAVPTTAGGLTLTVAPGLPGAMADNDPLTLQRTRVRNLLTDGVQSILGPLRVRATDADQLSDYFLIPAITTKLVVNGYDAGTSPIGTLRATQFETAGKLRLWNADYARFFYNSLPAGSIYDANIYAYSPLWNSGTSKLTVTVDPSYTYMIGSMTIGTTTLVPNVAGNIVDAAGNRRTFVNFPFVLDAIAGAVLTMVPDPRMLGSGETFEYVATMGSSSMPWSNTTWADGTTVTLTETLETRTLRLNGAHISGATSLAFKNVAELARRDILTTDAVYIKRRISGTVRVTAVSRTQIVGDDGAGGSYTYWKNDLSVDLATSTLDNLASADYTSQPVTIGGINVTLPVLAATTTLYSPAEFGLNDTFPMTYTVTMDVIDSYTPSTNASWNSAARATVSITIPSGRSYPQGTKVSTNFAGTFTLINGGMAFGESLMRLTAGVTGPASSITIETRDAKLGKNQYGVNYYSPLAVGYEDGACYRIKASAGSVIPIAGDVLFASVNYQVNASGVGNIPIKAANTVAFGDGTTITITRPSLIPADEPSTGNIVRMLGATWAGAGQLETKLPVTYIDVQSPAGIQITASVWFVLNLPVTGVPLTTPLTIKLVQ